MSPHNGWNEYKQLFKQLLGKVDNIDDKLSQALIKIARLEERNKIMSVIWGSLGGGLAVLITLAVRYVS